MGNDNGTPRVLLSPDHGCQAIKKSVIGAFLNHGVNVPAGGDHLASQTQDIDRASSVAQYRQEAEAEFNPAFGHDQYPGFSWLHARSASRIRGLIHKPEI